MKIVQLLGSRNKADFSLYLAHTVASTGKRVLIVDATANEIYRNGFIQFEEKEYLYELEEVEILCCATNWSEVEEKLVKAGEMSSNYDCIILDTDSIPSILADWPTAEMVLYVSDSDRFNVTKDVAYLHRYLDENNVSELRRVHFDSAFHIPDDYILLLMNFRMSFTGNSEIIEHDDIADYLRGMMQHDHIIPYSKLSKDYKYFLNELACELFEDLDIREVQKSARNRFSIFRSKKANMSSAEHVIGG